jgi:Fe-S-cluster containining protein
VAAEPRSGVKLIDRLRSGVGDADAEWEKAAAGTRPGDLLCREGCFGCCLGSFEISLPEALVLRDAVSALPESRRTRVRERAARLVARGAAPFPGDPIAGVLDPGRSEEQDAAYFDALEHVACPLLELPSGRCAVYESRPVTCRTYGLAWREERAVVHPACPLNLADATPAHTLETAVNVAPLLAGDQARAELARADGIPSGATTTVAHALVGTAFAEPRMREKEAR